MANNSYSVIIAVQFLPTTAAQICLQPTLKEIDTTAQVDTAYIQTLEVMVFIIYASACEH